MELTKKYVLAFMLLVGVVYFSNAGGNSILEKNNKNKSSNQKSGPGPEAVNNLLRYSSKVNALNFKLMPALYWNSLGLEVEFPIADMFSIGINALGKLGRTDGKNVVFKIRPETTQDPAYALEFLAKYYISKTAPIGFYGQLNFSYGNLLFFDGTNKPYTLHSKWKNFEGGIRTPTEVERPKDYSLGVGAGYQLVIIPKKIIANIFVGSQIYLEETAGVYPAIYVTPSLGYVF